MYYYPNTLSEYTKFFCYISTDMGNTHDCKCRPSTDNEYVCLTKFHVSVSKNYSVISIKT